MESKKIIINTNQFNTLNISDIRNYNNCQDLINILHNKVKETYLCNIIYNYQKPINWKILYINENIYNYNEKPIHVLIYLMKQKKYNIVYEILKNEDLSNFDINISDNSNKTLLHYTCIYNITNLIELLLNNKNLNINSYDINGNTPLIYSCIYNNIECVKYLLNNKKHYLDIDKRNRYLDNAMLIVTYKKYYNIKMLFLEHDRYKNDVYSYYDEDCMNAMVKARSVAGELHYSNLYSCT